EAEGAAARLVCAPAARDASFRVQQNGDDRAGARHRTLPNQFRESRRRPPQEERGALTSAPGRSPPRMSIAVAVRKGSTLAVAADSQENFGDRKVVGANHRATKIMTLSGSELAMTGWGVYDNVFHDYFLSRRAPRFANEREIFTFFVRLWKDLR